MVKLTSVCCKLRKTGLETALRVSRYRYVAKDCEYLFKERPEVTLTKTFDGTTELRSKHVIRLAKSGCTNRPFYRIVVSHKYDKRDSEIEQLGTFDPFPNLHNEKLCAINFERVKYHLAMGAHPVKSVRRLLGLSGFLPLDPTLLIFAEGLRRRRTIEKLINEQEAEELD